jgi:peptidoglycan/LPS O-acetylase OafA/YrhL
MEKNLTSKNVHKQLPNLDSVRALAAMIVVISHIELQKEKSGFTNIMYLVKNIGSAGVTIFFVLSGFLITYLLFKEHTAKSKINIRSFYFRRILRIWPLYFLVLLFGIFIYPRNVDSTGIVLSVFFLPNIAFMLHKLPLLIDPIWSLGVEEQFYLFHPHIFRMSRMRTIFNTLIGIFVFFYALKFCARKMHWDTCLNIMFKARFDCMMLGGIFSIWIVNFQRNNKYFKTLLSPSLIFNKPFQVLLYTFYVGYMILAIQNAAFYSDQLLSGLTACAIGNLALNQNCIISIENRVLTFIGKISFGLYLLHKFPVEFVVTYCRKFGIENVLFQNVFIYSIAISFSIALAYLSFHFYESHFLKLKDKKFATEAPAKLNLEAALGLKRNNIKVM